MEDDQAAPYVREFEAEAAKLLATMEEYDRPLRELLQKFARKYATDHGRA